MSEEQTGYTVGREERGMEELDRAVAERVMDWHETVGNWEHHWADAQGVVIRRIEFWHPSTNIADAMTVADKLIAEGWDFRLIKHAKDRRWSVRFERTTGYQYIDGWAEKPAEAICLAALKVMEFREMMAKA